MDRLYRLSVTVVTRLCLLYTWCYDYIVHCNRGVSVPFGVETQFRIFHTSKSQKYAKFTRSKLILKICDFVLKVNITNGALKNEFCSTISTIIKCPNTDKTVYYVYIGVLKLQTMHCYLDV